MIKLIKSVSVGMLILVILPLLVWCSGWHWQPEHDRFALPFLYLMTQTVTRPWGIVTTLILTLALLIYQWRQGARFTALLKTVVLIVVVVWGGQGINTLIKHQVKEPRPYAVWMQQVTGTPVARFYQQPVQVRSQWVNRVTDRYPQLPQWLKQHWAWETGYAFPSGHSMFAACWALLMLVLLWPGRHYFILGLVFAWAILVMWSRMAMGMHWPRDVIMSVIIASFWVVIVCRGLNILPQRR